MNNLVIETVSTIGVAVGCIVIGIIALALFFYLASWLTSTATNRSSLNTFSIDGLIQNDTLITVRLEGGETYSQVRMVGEINFDAARSYVPFELHGMIVLEDRQGAKIIVRAKSIQTIFIDAPAEESVNS